MKIVYLSFLFFSLPVFAQRLERRCGWLDNPTPGNWFLTDRDRSWDIALQGIFIARGLENVTINNATNYVRTNGNYGYTCACMDVTTNRARITSLRNFRQLSLKQCLEDPNLPSR